MNFVDRLKDFLKNRDISVSQFADRCDIPRPTMSQLLNGRNKKVSDELIRKIHQGYPDLSVLWLMFGEGPVTVAGAPTPPSPKQTVKEPTTTSSSQPPLSSISFDIPSPSSSQAVSSSAKETPGASDSLFEDFDQDSESVAANVSDADLQTEEAAAPTSISFSESSSERRIATIIVYYSDNSFESFVPMSKKSQV